MLYVEERGGMMHNFAGGARRMWENTPLTHGGEVFAP